MGNRRKASRPNSRTRQKRSAARLEWELEHMDDEDEPSDAAQAPAAGTSPRSLLSRFFLLEKQAAGPAPADETAWTRRGLATMCLVAGVLCIPLGFGAFVSDHRVHPYGAYFVGIVDPASLVPIYLVVTLLLAMPLARRLAREARPLRILETLGFAAVVQILLIFFWAPVLRDNTWYDHADAIVGAAVADLGAFAGAVVFYPAITAWFLRRRARR